MPEHHLYISGQADGLHLACACWWEHHVDDDVISLPAILDIWGEHLCHADATPTSTPAHAADSAPK